jgi:hypothetical protein
MQSRTTSQALPQVFTLWMERGFSRSLIAIRMVEAAKLVGVDLRIISTPEQPLDGTTVLALPLFEEGASAIKEANRLIAEHHIDALWVQNSAVYDLSGLTCTVHAAAAPDVIELVDDKARFNEWLGDDPARLDATEVRGVDAAIAEYGRRSLEQEVCVKPVKGVNGNGYWHLTRTESLIFSDVLQRRMPPEAYFSGLAGEEDPERPLLFMEWLPGLEVSIDILCWNGEVLIHAARTKVGKNEQDISSDHPMVEHARGLAKRKKFHGLISVQYKQDRPDNTGNWKALEINPRPAGGSIYSEDAGFGIITAWILLILGAIRPEDIKQHYDDVTVEFERVAHIVHKVR